MRVTARGAVGPACRLPWLAGRGVRSTGLRSPHGAGGSTTEMPRHPYAGARRGRRVADRPCSIPFILFRNCITPKSVNRLENLQNKSCRRAIDLQLSQGVTYVLINHLSGNVGRSWQKFRPQVTVHSAFNSIFGQFALKIGMSINYKKCVPGNNEQLRIGRF
jgi:hypothetical protein